MEFLSIMSTVVVIIASVILVVNLILITISLWGLWRIDRLRYKISKLRFRIDKIIEEEFRRNSKTKREKD